MHKNLKLIVFQTKTYTCLCDSSASVSLTCASFSYPRNLQLNSSSCNCDMRVPFILIIHLVLVFSNVPKERFNPCWFFDCSKLTTSTQPPTSVDSTTSSMIPAGCDQYQVLDSPTRKISFKTPSGQWKCDKVGFSNINQDWKGQHWYRFMEPAGTQMPESPPRYGHCGTAANGWIEGTHPTNVGETKTAYVCFVWTNTNCGRKEVIQIRHCGKYYLYNLPNIRFCTYGYCSV